MVHFLPDTFSFFLFFFEGGVGVQDYPWSVFELFSRMLIEQAQRLIKADLWPSKKEGQSGSILHYWSVLITIFFSNWLCSEYVQCHWVLCRRFTTNADWFVRANEPRLLSLWHIRSSSNGTLAATCNLLGHEIGLCRAYRAAIGSISPSLVVYNLSGDLCDPMFWSEREKERERERERERGRSKDPI